MVTRVYGSTEVPVTTVGVTQRDDAAHAADTDGRAGLARIKLAGADGAPADEGEILARAPQMLVGYLHAEDLSLIHICDPGEGGRIDQAQAQEARGIELRHGLPDRGIFLLSLIHI